MWVSVVPFIRPIKLNIQEISRKTEGRDRFTARCRIKTLTQAFPLPSATLISPRSGFPLASVPPPPSRCLAAVLQYSRCYSQTVCTTFQPSAARTSFKSKLAGNRRGAGFSARGRGSEADSMTSLPDLAFHRVHEPIRVTVHNRKHTFRVYKWKRINKAITLSVPSNFKYKLEK